MLNNRQERHKHPPAWSPPTNLHITHTHSLTHSLTHKHAASLQKYLEPICTNDYLCLMHFLEDGAGYSFKRRDGVGEVSGRSALPYGFPSAHFSWPIFQERAQPALGSVVIRFITGKVGRSPDCLKYLELSSSRYAHTEEVPGR